MRQYTDSVEALDSVSIAEPASNSKKKSHRFKIATSLGIGAALILTLVIILVPILLSRRRRDIEYERYRDPYLRSEIDPLLPYSSYRRPLRPFGLEPGLGNRFRSPGKPQSLLNRERLYDNHRRPKRPILYWPICNNLHEYMRGTNLLDFQIMRNVFYASDRFDRPNRALQIQNGLLTVPSFTYFSRAFTITFWIKLIQAGRDAIFLDFNSGDEKLTIQLTDGRKPLPYLLLRKGIIETTLKSEVPIRRNKWVHMAITLNEDHLARMYYDGVLVTSDSLTFLPESVGATSNVIGTNSTDKEAFLEMTFDDLAFYNFAMTQEEIVRDLTFYFRCRNDLNRRAHQALEIETQPIKEFIRQKPWPLSSPDDMNDREGFSLDTRQDYEPDNDNEDDEDKDQDY